MDISGIDNLATAVEDNLATAVEDNLVTAAVHNSAGQ